MATTKTAKVSWRMLDKVACLSTEWELLNFDNIQEVDQFSMLPVIAELKDTEQVQSLDEQCTGFRGLDHPYRYGKHVLL